MNTLYGLHTCPEKFVPDSPMDLWLRRHGYASLKKLMDRLNAPEPLPIKFIPNNPDFAFESLIDPDNKFGVEDKLSQVQRLFFTIFLANDTGGREHLI